MTMSNFDFDYIVERAQVLEEMAAPTRIFNFVSPEFNSLLDTLSKHLLEGGIVQLPTRRNIIYRFILVTLNDMGSLFGETEDGEEMSSLDIVRHMGHKTSTQGVEAAVLQLLRDNLDLARSPKVINHLSNTENLDAYKRILNDDSGARGRKKGKNNQLLNLTGKGINANEAELSELRNILLKVHKVMGDKKRRKNPNQVVADNSPSTPNQKYAKTVLAALDELKTTKDSINPNTNMDPETELLSRVPGEVINSLVTKFTQIHAAGGLTPEEFDEKLEKLASIQGMPQSALEFFSVLADTVELYHETSGEEPAEVGNQNYFGYDMKVVNSVVEDPETLKRLKAFIANMDAVRKDNLEKLENLDTKRWLDMLVSSHENVKNNITGYKAEDEYIKNLQSQKKKIMDMMRRNPDKKDSYSVYLKQIDDKIAEQWLKRSEGSYKRREEDPTSPPDRNTTTRAGGRVDYMHEQVKKDALLHPKGTFVSRFTKKPINSYHATILKEEL